MQNFITIFHSVQELGPFVLFQNLELGKARPMKNVISQSLGLDLANINVYAKVYQNIPLSSTRDVMILRRKNKTCERSPGDLLEFQWLRQSSEMVGSLKCGIN